MLAYWPADQGEALLDLPLGGLLAQRAQSDPDRVALVDGVADPGVRQRWTYARLHAQSLAVAAALLGQLEPGERLGVWSPNCPEWLLLQYGAALAGVTLVPINPAFRRAEVEYVLRQSRSAAVAVGADWRGNPLMETVRALEATLPDLRCVLDLGDLETFSANGKAELPVVGVADTAMIVYTSGTTGAPKGAMLSHYGVVNNAWLLSQRLELPAESVWLNPMPMFHVSGNIWFAGGAVAAGGTHVLMRAYDPALVCQLIEDERATVLLAVPTMLVDLLETLKSTDVDLSSLLIVASGGSPIAADLARRVEERMGARFSAGYGQTESSQVITQVHADDTLEDKVGTNGQPLPHTELRIVDVGTGEVVPAGSIGEICVRGYGVMQGYFDMEEATAGAIDPDGWLHTGDLGTMDERGYVQITGRLREMIIRGGENVYPREIEDVLFTHPAVAEVAVVGVPDARLGEEIAAFVRARRGADVSSDDLRLFVRERLAPFKTPRHWRFVDELPVTASGKVQKFRLREAFSSTTEEGSNKPPP